MTNLLRDDAEVTALVMIVPVPVVMFVESVVVLDAAVLAFPIAGKILAAIMTRGDPTRADVGRTGPISLVPLPVPADRIPISFHPDEFRPGTSRNNLDYPRRRRGADLDSDRNLAKRCTAGQKR